MKAAYISYQQTKRFSKLMCDFLNENDKLAPFHTATPSLHNLQNQANLKKKDFSASKRAILYNAINAQYTGCTHTEQTEQNLRLLNTPNAVTITTGHQLSLMTGPLFFIYKIITTIKLCQELNDTKDGNHYLPVYWMATEDHDFEEIQSFQFEGKKIQWNRSAGGAVGKMDLTGLDAVLDLLETHLGTSQNATALKTMIEKSYRSSKTLTEATRKLVHELFGDYGLLIVDGDSPVLKALFVPAMKDDLLTQNCFKYVNNQIEQLQSDYDPSFKPQVNPREINLFYLEEEGRNRIVKGEDGFHLEGSERHFSTTSMLKELDKHPERFSPNVLLRPLYQETILPNICYIGGGGELAYWLELNTFFKAQKIPFPIILMRNSALLMEQKLAKKRDQLSISNDDLFLDRTALINKKIRQISNIDLDLSPLKQKLDEQFDYLEGLIKQTDASFEGTVRAQKVKQFKGIDQLEKRLLNAQKKKLADQVTRMSALHQALFPENGLQERQENFSVYFLALGLDLIPMLMKNFKPLSSEFTIITY